LVLLLLSAGFVGAVYFSVAQVVRAFAQNQAQFNQIYGSISEWATRWGLQESGALEGYSRLINFGQTLLSNAYAIVGYLGFVAIIVILGIVEVPDLRERLQDTLEDGDRRELIATVDEIGEQIRRYISVTALTSAITGFASALWAFSVGLELALVWGVLNFLLNFIPIVGNIIGIVPPTLFAIIQFQSVSWAVIVFSGFAILQIVISNVIYPMLQGRSLSLSPVVILVSLAFWGWVWGIAGALLAVPITAAIVITCEHFRSTEWIARLLSNRSRGHLRPHDVP
jgi:predicted PurR-regulated permease PerM